MNEWDRQVFIAETGIDPVADSDEEVRHCEWRPIQDAPKFSGGVFVWNGGELIEVHWSRKYRNDPLSWCQIESDRYGDEVCKLEPQPKYYLEVVPPPEE